MEEFHDNQFSRDNSNLEEFVHRIMNAMCSIFNPPNCGYSFQVLRQFPFNNMSMQQKRYFYNLRTSRDYRTDIAVILKDERNRLIYEQRPLNSDYGIVLIGEIRSSRLSVEQSLNQLVTYQIFLERPYDYDQNSYKLLGFVIDEDVFELQELSICSWFNENQVERTSWRYKRTNDGYKEYFISRCCQVVLTRLNERIAEHQLGFLNRRNNYLTFRFPFENYSVLLHCNVVSITLQQFRAHIEDNFIFDYEITNLRGPQQLPDDCHVILKANGSFFSGGKMSQREEFSNMLHNFAHRNPNDLDCFQKTLFELYIAIFHIGESNPYTFTLMRHIGFNSPNCKNCEEIKLNQYWNDSFDLRHLFYTDVYLVVMNSLKNNWFHWDLRRANVLYFGTAETHFFQVIDWESSYSISSNRSLINEFFTNSKNTNIAKNSLNKLSVSRNGYSVRLAYALMELIVNKFIQQYVLTFSNFLNVTRII